MSFDEKTQIQALERAQHTLFPQKNLPSHQSNDYCRHGTTTLFTALDYLTGKVDELIRAIKAYIHNWNKSDRKFRWSKSSDVILQKIKKHKGVCSSI